jgi:multiple sugar transport system permease protein
MGALPMNVETADHDHFLDRAPRAYRLAVYCVLSLVALVYLAPIAWMVRTAFTPAADTLTLPVPLFPKRMDLSSFQTLWNNYPFVTFYWNSLQIAVLATIGQLISCSFTAYALASLRFPGRQLLLLVILGTIMIPFQVTMVPMFVLMNKIGWIDTHYPLWVPSFFGDVTGAFGIFLLYQGFRIIPYELFEAARVDGANPWHRFVHVALPLSKSYLAVLTVFAFMTSWNDFLRPIIYLTTPEKMTITGALGYFQTQFHVYWNEIMAGALLAMIPMMVLYVLAQRYFIEAGFSAGVKG